MDLWNKEFSDKEALATHFIHLNTKKSQGEGQGWRTRIFGRNIQTHTSQGNYRGRCGGCDGPRDCSHLSGLRPLTRCFVCGQTNYKTTRILKILHSNLVEHLIISSVHETLHMKTAPPLAGIKICQKNCSRNRCGSSTNMICSR